MAWWKMNISPAAYQNADLVQQVSVSEDPATNKWRIVVDYSNNTADALKGEFDTQDEAEAYLAALITGSNGAS